MKRLLTTLVILTGLLGSGGAVRADAESDYNYNKGWDAFAAGNCAEGVKWYRAAAAQGDVDARDELPEAKRLCEAKRRTEQGIEGSKGESALGRAEAKRRAEQAAKAKAKRDAEQAAEAKAKRLAETKAVKWMRKAADQGLAKAQFNLGMMYEVGRGVVQDYAEAVKWYRKAAEKAGFDNVDVYLKAKAGGFTDPATYQKARAGGFKNAKDFAAAEKAGFKKADVYLKAKAGGFSSPQEMQKIIFLGFKNKDVFEKAQKIGAANFEEYKMLRELGVTKECALFIQKSELEQSQWSNDENAFLASSIKQYVTANMASVDLEKVSKFIRRLKNQEGSSTASQVCSFHDDLKTWTNFYQELPQYRKAYLDKEIKTANTKVTEQNKSINARIKTLRVFAVEHLTEEVGLSAINISEAAAKCVVSVDKLPVRSRAESLGKCNARFFEDTTKKIMSLGSYTSLQTEFGPPLSAKNDAESNGGSVPVSPVGVTYKMSEPIRRGQLEITIIKFETAESFACGYSSETAPGGSLYVGVYWSAKNVSSTPADWDPAFELYDTANKAALSTDYGGASAYSACLVKRGNPITDKILSDLNPLIKVYGATAFNVAKELWDPKKFQIRGSVRKSFFKSGKKFRVAFEY